MNIVDQEPKAPKHQLLGGISPAIGLLTEGLWDILTLMI